MQTSLTLLFSIAWEEPEIGQLLPHALPGKRQDMGEQRYPQISFHNKCDFILVKHLFGYYKSVTGFYISYKATSVGVLLFTLCFHG